MRPRPEFLRAYREHRVWKRVEFGGRGRMLLRKGYYASNGRFILDEEAEEKLKVDEKERSKLWTAGAVVLLLVTTCMVIVTLCILVFRMLMTMAWQFADNAYFNPTYGSAIGSVLNVGWIKVMNVIYGKLARAFNELENHRTDSEAEDALILKTFVFQFCNSYGGKFAGSRTLVGRCLCSPAFASLVQQLSSTSPSSRRSASRHSARSA